MILNHHDIYMYIFTHMCLYIKIDKYAYIYIHHARMISIYTYLLYTYDSKSS